MAEDKRIIEVAGVKLEVDLREATQVETYKVGDPIRVLKKKWDKNWDVYSGVILGFDGFTNRPTITVGIINLEGKMEYLVVHKDTTDIEIAPMHEVAGMLEKDDILDKMDRLIDKAEEALRTAKSQRHYFIKYYSKYFGELVTENSEEETA